MQRHEFIGTMRMVGDCWISSDAPERETDTGEHFDKQDGNRIRVEGSDSSQMADEWSCRRDSSSLSDIVVTTL